MFVNRSVKKSSTRKNVSQGAASVQQQAQKRAAVVGLAVAATVSVASVTFTRLQAQDTSLDNAPVKPLSLADVADTSDIGLLKQGLEQFKNKQYEDAKATLAQVKAESLSASDQKKLAATLADADAAIARRSEARTQFDQGEAALNAGKLDEAKSLYKSAADSKFADEGTRQKAKEQIGLLNAMQAQKATELKGEYQQAKKAFEAGDYAVAKPSFEKLDAAGFKAPAFQTSPRDYLKKIDAKLAAAAPETGGAAAAVDTPAAPAVAAPAQPAQPEVNAQAEAAAPAVDVKAEKARLEAEAKAAKEAERAKAKEEQARAKAEQEAAEANAKAAQKQARDQYKTGLAALKAGDYAAARESFKAADAGGFKPALFEASAAKMLATVDQQEAAAKAKVEAAEAKAKEVEIKGEADAGVAEAKKTEDVTKAQAEADRKAAEALAKAEKEAAEAKAKADKLAAEASAKAEKEAAKAQAKAEMESAATRQVAARQHYKTGLTALKANDWEAARAAFKAADEGGFKPGLFEPSAVKMLAEVDQEEASAKAKAERLAAKQAEEAQKAQAEADRKAAEAQAKAQKEAAEAQAKAAEAQAKVTEPTPTVAVQPQPEVKVEATTPAVDAAPEVKPEAKVEGTTPAVEVKPEVPAVEVKPEVKVETPVVATPTAQAELDATAKMDQIRAQARAYESQRLVEQAQLAQKEGRVADAFEVYSKAVEADPTNQAAVAGKNQMAAVTGRAPAAVSALDEIQVANGIRRQNITYSFNDSIDRARAAIAANRFDEAGRQINSAVIARDQDPNLFTTEQVKAFDTTVAQARQELAAARETYNAKEAERIAADRKRAAEELELVRTKDRQATISSLITQTRNYVSKHQYREALAVTDQILVVDPTNDYARSVRPLIEDKAALQQQREARELFNRNWVNTLNNAEEALVPYDDIYRFPSNWPDISERRDQTVQQEQGLKEADRQVQIALERKLPEVRFDGQSFDDVIEFLRDTTGTNIFVNWKALDQVPIDRKATVVTGRLREIKFSKVLQTVLDSVSTDPNNKLTYTVDEGVITISTTQDVAARTVTRVYDITDLIISIPTIDPGDADFGGGTSGSNSGSGSSGGSRSGGGSSFGGSGGSRSGGGSRSSGGGSRSGGSSGGVFGSSGGSSGSGGSSSSDFDRQASLEEIALMVEETVAVDTWESMGGQGTIRPSPLNQQLIITQTPEVHRKIQTLLDQLRETLAIQVTVECRFLTVSRNFMEDVGLDFDFTFNTEDPNRWSPMTVSQGSSSFTANPVTGVPGTIGAQGITPALETRGTYLDNFNVNFLLRATQAMSNQSVVTAPRVTVYNGGEAQVIVQTNTSYVASLEPEVASGVVGYTPEIGVATDGVSLYVRANVSADRKYVTLYLLPRLQRLLELVPFTFQSATTLPTGGSGGTNVFAQGSLTIQEPRQQEVTVETLVAVPDGGTLLLGGQTLSGEVEREAGVPVLSKIPILKRLFTNRSTAKDESVLLILVKPTIIINKEQEAIQHPLLSTKISGR